MKLKVDSEDVEFLHVLSTRFEFLQIVDEFARLVFNLGDLINIAQIYHKLAHLLLPVRSSPISLQ